MLTNPRFFSTSLSCDLTRAFATKAAKSPLNPSFKKNMEESWDATYESVVKKVVMRLEPNNYENVMNHEMPDFDLLFGEQSATPDFNSDIFMATLMKSIAKMLEKVKIDQKYTNQLIELNKDYSSDEIIAAIKAVLPDP